MNEFEKWWKTETPPLAGLIVAPGPRSAFIAGLRCAAKIAKNRHAFNTQEDIERTAKEIEDGG